MSETVICNQAHVCKRDSCHHKTPHERNCANPMPCYDFQWKADEWPDRNAVPVSACVPTPSLEGIKGWMVETQGKGGIARRDHVEWLIAELTTLTEIYRKQLADQQELYELRRTIYRLGHRLIGEEMDEQDQVAIGGEMVDASRLCSSCGGTGEDGDEDGGTYACHFCEGTGLV